MLTAIAGSGMLSFSIAMNAITVHGTCTVVFVVVGAIIAFLVSSIQTLDKISWIGWVGVVSIVSSVITLAVACGVSERPSAAPQTGPFEIDVKASANPPFVDAINALNIIIFAYAGTPCFFNIVGEMRNVKDYTKSVLVCQTAVTMVYLVSWHKGMELTVDYRISCIPLHRSIHCQSSPWICRCLDEESLLRFGHSRSIGRMRHQLAHACQVQ